MAGLGLAGRVGVRSPELIDASKSLFRTLPWYSDVIVPISLFCVSMPNADDPVAATKELAGMADRLEEAVVAIQVQNPSAELAYWTRVTLRRLRAMATADPPITSSEQVADAFFARVKSPEHPDLIAQNQELRRRHLEDATQFTDHFGPAPTPAFFDLHRVMDRLGESARAACCVAEPG